MNIAITWHLLRSSTVNTKYSPYHRTFYACYLYEFLQNISFQGSGLFLLPISLNLET